MFQTMFHFTYQCCEPVLCFEGRLSSCLKQLSHVQRQRVMIDTPPYEGQDHNGHHWKHPFRILSCIFLHKLNDSAVNKMEKSANYQGSGFGPGPQSGPINIVQSVPRVPSTLSVSGVDVGVMSSAPSHAISTLTLTPGRTRDIDQDMEALRISRQDNPFLQQVLASRESLAESLEESESDDANLMTQDFPSEIDPDPLTLPEIHEHMIRSPPPTSWPRSPNYKVFRFPGSDDESSQESVSVRKSPSRVVSPRQSRGVLVLEEMARELLRSPASHDRVGTSGFSLLSPAPMRSLSEVRRLHSRSTDDSEQLVSSEPEGNICVT